MTDYKELAAQKEELKTAWDFLDISFEYPTKQVPLWLLEYGKEMIESAFQALAKKADKVEDPVKYLTGVLRNSKQQGMTPEEREEQISALRAAAARVKAQKAHAAKMVAESRNLANVLQTDAEFCRELQDVSVGVGVEVLGLGLDKGVSEGQESKPVASLRSSPPQQTLTKQHPNQNQDQNQEQPRKVSSKTCKKCGVALVKNVNHRCGGSGVAAEPNQQPTPTPENPCSLCGGTERHSRKCADFWSINVSKVAAVTDLRKLGVEEL